MAKGWSFGALVKALKGAAFLDIGTVANSVAAGDDGRIVNALQKGNNLRDVADINTSRNTLFAAHRNGDSNVDFFCRDNGDPTAAVNNQRLDFRLQSKANTKGNQYEQFDVGGATNGTHAVRLDQFQSGSNGNGAWIKLPGGGQWCRTNITIPAKGGITWNFPIGFVSAPAVFVTNINGAQSIWPTGVGPNNASFYNDNPTPSNVNLLAIW